MSLNKTRLILVIGFLLVIIGTSFTFAIKTYKQTLVAKLPRVPNILIVTTCSLRMKMLEHYGWSEKSVMPGLDQFFKDSTYVFENAVNGLSWTSLFGYVSVQTPKKVLQHAGYNFIGTQDSGMFLRVPLKYSRRTGVNLSTAVDNNDFEKDMSETLADLKRRITAAGHKPFFLMAHMKYAHYPFIDRFNYDAEWDHYLNKVEKNKIIDNLSHPEKFYYKLPYLLLLANNPYHVLMHPKFKDWQRTHESGEIRRLSGLVTNRDLLAEWKASPEFAEDLQILEKVYRANLRYLDKSLADLLNLYGDQDLKDRTLVVYAGDHGEMHMEHDELTHGGSLWEESLRIPMAIRFPGGEGERIKINKQVHMGTMAMAIERIAKGENKTEDFPRILTDLHDDLVIGRNCANTIRGLRYKNKFKYFFGVNDGTKYLFDLEADPKELNNLAEKQPETASEMETLYWENYGRFVRWDPYECSPWFSNATRASDAG
jgi:hypothetical protein